MTFSPTLNPLPFIPFRFWLDLFQISHSSRTNASLSIMPPIKNYLPRVVSLNDENEDELKTFLTKILEHEHEI